MKLHEHFTLIFMETRRYVYMQRGVVGWGGFPDIDFPRYTIIFQDLKDSVLSIFKVALRFRELISRTVSRFHQSSNIIQNVYEHFSKIFQIQEIYLGSKIIHNHSRFSEIPPSRFSVLFWTIEIVDCCGRTKNPKVWCPTPFKQSESCGFPNSWDM